MNIIGIVIITPSRNLCKKRENLTNCILCYNADLFCNCENIGDQCQNNYKIKDINFQWLLIATPLPVRDVTPSLRFLNKIPCIVLISSSPAHNCTKT